VWSGGQDHTIRVWRSSDGVMTHTLSKHSQYVLLHLIPSCPWWCTHVMGLMALRCVGRCTPSWPTATRACGAAAGTRRSSCGTPAPKNQRRYSALCGVLHCDTCFDTLRLQVLQDVHDDAISALVAVPGASPRVWSGSWDKSMCVWE
jgi:hypothetical protein